MMLRWMTTSAGVREAFSGTLRVGFVLCRSGDGRWAWSIDAVHMKWIGKGSGDVISERAARQAVERGWQRWLVRAGLTPDL